MPELFRENLLIRFAQVSLLKKKKQGKGVKQGERERDLIQDQEVAW